MSVEKVMGASTWKTLIIAAGLAVVAVTTGTAVFAAIGDQDNPPATRQTLDAPRGDGADVASACLVGAEDCDDTEEGGGVVSAVCAPGYPDCEDMIVDGGFEQCATEEPCGDFDERCAANTDCIAPGFLPEELVCPQGLSYDACFPDGAPEGWDCVELESFPVQVKCYPIGCTPTDGPVTILPVPTEDLPIETEVEPSDPSLIDPGNDPVIIDPVPAPSVPYRCLPADCAVSSDGVISCPLPLPCPEVEGDDAGCSTPGSCGDLGCDPVPCQDGITPEECEKILDEQRRNSAGGGTSSSGGDIDSSE